MVSVAVFKTTDCCNNSLRDKEQNKYKHKKSNCDNKAPKEKKEGPIM